MTFKFPRWAADAIISALQVALLSKAPPSSTRRGAHGRRSRAAHEKSRALARLVSEQGIKPVHDFRKLALDDPDEVPLEEFSSFIRTVRRGGPASG